MLPRALINTWNPPSWQTTLVMVQSWLGIRQEKEQSYRTNGIPLTAPSSSTFTLAVHHALSTRWKSPTEDMAMIPIPWNVRICPGFALWSTLSAAHCVNVGRGGGQSVDSVSSCKTDCLWRTTLSSETENPRWSRSLIRNHDPKTWSTSMPTPNKIKYNIDWGRTVFRSAWPMLLRVAKQGMNYFTKSLRLGVRNFCPFSKSLISSEVGYSSLCIVCCPDLLLWDACGGHDDSLCFFINGTRDSAPPSLLYDVSSHILKTYKLPCSFSTIYSP